MAKTEDVAFAIISAAGDGRAKVAEALKQARRGNFGEAEECLKDADEHLLKAHKLQTEELLQKEANGELQGPFDRQQIVPRQHRAVAHAGALSRRRR